MYCAQYCNVSLPTSRTKTFLTDDFIDYQVTGKRITVNSVCGVHLVGDWRHLLLGQALVQLKKSITVTIL